MKNKRNTARFLSFLTVLAVLLTAGIVLGVNASAEEGAKIEVSNGADLATLLSGGAVNEQTLADGDTIVLTADVYMGTDATCTVAAKTVTITSAEGGPYTIYRGVQGQTAIKITVATPMFSMEKGAKVTLTNVVLDGQKDVITDEVTTGGAFYYYNATADTKFTTTLTLGEGAVIQNFAAMQGGAVGFTYATLIIVDGGTISNNQTSASGGGVDANSTRFTFTDGTISNNTAGSHGGGVILRNVSVLTMGADSVISNCTSGDAGGGICVYGSKDQTLSAGTVTNCTAKRGGGIATLTNTITVTLSGVTISNNEATSTSTNQGGGGVYFIGSTCVLSGSDILDNEAKRGGGIFFTTGTLTMADGTVSGNTATVNGGGIAFTTGTLTMNGGAVSSNTATSGDAVYSTGNLVLTDGSVTDDKIYFVEGTLKLDGVSADNFVANAETSHLDFTVTSANGNTMAVTMPGSFAAVKNGYVYNDFEAAIAAADEGAIIWKYIELPTDATYTFPTGTYTVDGDGKTFKRAVTGVPMFTVPENANVTLTNITLDGNSIADTATSGGAIHLNSDSALTLMGEGTAAPVIRGFFAKQGGAIYSAGALTIENAIIQQNTTSSNGGGIYLGGGSFTMNGGLIGGSTTDEEGNVVSLGNVGKAGGGIAVATSGEVTINGGTISYNSTPTASGNNGGGIYTTASADKVTIGGKVVISNNTAGYRGGGIYAVGDLVLMGNASVSSNTSSDHGGGIYATTDSHVWMLGGKLIGNQSNKYNASALYVSTFAYIGGGEISGNVMNYTSNSISDTYGGAVHVAGASLYLAGGTIHGNTSMHNNGTVEDKYKVFADKEILLKNANAQVYLGASVTFGEDVVIPDAVATAEGFTVDGQTITSSNALVMDNDDNRNFVYYNATATRPELVSDLNAGSKVVFADNDATDGYFVTLAADYTPSTATLNAICLAGADSLYNAKVEDATLVWPSADAESYQVVVSAVIGSDIGFRVAFARRDATDNTVLDGVTAKVTANVYDEELNDWVEKKDQLRDYTTGTYYGSPCIILSFAPKEAMDQIIIEKNGKIVNKDEVAYTLASYLKQLISDEKYGDLAKATLNYCAAAQTYFKHGCKFEQDLATYGVDGLPAVDVVGTFTATKESDIFYGAQVDIASTVSVAIIVQSKSNATFKIGAAEASTVAAENYREVKDVGYAIVIPDLYATQLLETIEVTIDGKTMTYSVPAYAYRMQEKLTGSTEQEDINLVALVQALYAYADAAAKVPAN